VLWKAREIERLRTDADRYRMYAIQVEDQDPLRAEDLRSDALRNLRKIDELSAEIAAEIAKRNGDGG
jgi:hypothetical protein